MVLAKLTVVASVTGQRQAWSDRQARGTEASLLFLSLVGFEALGYKYGRAERFEGW